MQPRANNAPSARCGNVLVVDLHVADERFVQVLAAVKADGGEHLGDAAVEALGPYCWYENGGV